MKKKLIYTSLLLSALSLVAKVLGFIKESLLANFYGATYITDGYLMAQNITITIFCSFTSAIAIGYITTMINKNDDNRTLNSILNAFFLFFTALGIIGFIFAPFIIRLFAPGFDVETVNITTTMLRIILPFSLFYSFLYIISADLQAKNIFWHIGVFNLIANVILILSVILSNKNYVLLCLGFGLSIVIPALFVFFINVKNGFKYKMRIYKDKTLIKKVIAVSYPVLFIEVFTNVMTLIDRSFASSIGEGIITNINYANRIITLFLTFFVSIISTVLLPTLVQKAEKKDLSEFKSASAQIVLYDLLIILFITSAILTTNREMVNVLFYHGAFSLENSIITSQLLKIYSIGLISLSLNSLLKSQLYALKRSKTTMYLTAISIFMNIILDWLLVKFLGYKGLAIASVISSFVLSIMFFVLLFKLMKENYSKLFYKNLAKIIISFIIILGVGLILNHNIGISSSLIKLILILMVEALIYLILLLLFKVDLIKDIKDALFRRRSKNESSKQSN